MSKNTRSVDRPAAEGLNEVQFQRFRRLNEMMALEIEAVDGMNVKSPTRLVRLVELEKRLIRRLDRPSNAVSRRSPTTKAFQREPSEPAEPWFVVGAPRFLADAEGVTPKPLTESSEHGERR